MSAAILTSNPISCSWCSTYTWRNSTVSSNTSYLKSSLSTNPIALLLPHCHPKALEGSGGFQRPLLHGGRGSTTAPLRCCHESCIRRTRNRIRGQDKKAEESVCPPPTDPVVPARLAPAPSRLASESEPRACGLFLLL